MSESNDVVDLTATNDSCIDVGDANGAVVVRSCKSADYCLVNTCVRKCCPEDEAMVNTTCQKLPPHLTLSKWHNEVWNIPRRLGNSSNEIINTTGECIYYYITNCSIFCCPFVQWKRYSNYILRGVENEYES